VLSLIRALPNEIVEEQVRNYRERSSTAVAAVPAHPDKLRLGTSASSDRLGVKMMVAARFHRYCHSHGIHADKKLPYNFMETFIKDNIEWKGNNNDLLKKRVRRWYESWRN